VLITCGLMEVVCLCGITNKEDGTECVRQRYTCRVFHFTDLSLSREEIDRV
jgi:deoxyhypusine synthase